MKQAVGLADFAASQPRAGTTCWVCSIPERAEIDAARRAGVASVPQMVRWLKGVKGQPQATTSRLNYHFGREHHCAQ